ncbi:MAG: hypothetical protein AAF590_03250 [Pseudomonadota bacterium]
MARILLQVMDLWRLSELRVGTAQSPLRYHHEVAAIWAELAPLAWDETDGLMMDHL